MKICCIFNYAPHYRYPIYKEMSKNFNVDFYFGNILPTGEQIKKMDLCKLNGFKGEFDINVYNKFIVWKNLLPLVFKKYDTYILTGRTKIINQWFFLILAKLMHKRTYNWWHGFAPGHELRGFRRYKEKIFFSLFTGHFIYGDKARKNMINMGFSANKMFTIYNSLNYDSSLIYRKEGLKSDIFFKHFKNTYPTLLFIGRLTKIKKLDLLIHAYNKLESLGLKCNLVLIGDGPERKKLENLSKNKDHIWFYGSLYDEYEIAKLLYNADLCISPGNVGLTAIHSIYYGLPVITNNNFTIQMPEHEAIIPKKTGDFFIEDSEESLVNVILDWFKINKNRDYIRQECYKIADNIFNPHNQIDILKSVLF